MSQKMWMVRAGEAAYLVEEFKKKNVVAIGWMELGNLTKKSINKNDLINLTKEKYPDAREGQIVMSASQFYKFIKDIKIDDYVLTYNPNDRKYLIAKVKSDWQYEKDFCGDYPNYRKVEWIGDIDRDKLSISTKNTLGAISTLFEIRNSAKQEILSLLTGKAQVIEDQEETEKKLDDLREDLISRSNEFIKDKIMTLDWEEMQELVAGILRAMGFKTKVSSKGADRGKDIIASPDGLGLENPRIFVEVKHRTSQVDTKQIRSFIGALRQESKGLYISTGGFSKEAYYEAERSIMPITLINADDLINLIRQNYDNFDSETKTLIPLTKIYWPA